MVSRRKMAAFVIAIHSIMACTASVFIWPPIGRVTMCLAVLRIF